MVRWFKLFGNQYVGFWVLGLVLFAIQEIPYMLMPLFRLETNPIMNMTETSAVLNICEKLLGSLCIAFMVFVVHKNAIIFSLTTGKEKLFFMIAMVILLANYFGWALYFTGHQSIFVMMLFIVIMPPLYYVAIGLWRQNTPLAITGGVFLAVHFLHVLGNLRGTSL
ncbi:MAG: hypothetical protein II038_07460 [Lachnospiraceae bacterium]|nr:hypothetical protein [Lachnospiraceae bacterium]